MHIWNLFLEKLLLSSNKTQDYAFTVKGCPTADGIDDFEEFKATEVSEFALFASSCGKHTIPRGEHFVISRGGGGGESFIGRIEIFDQSCIRVSIYYLLALLSSTPRVRQRSH